MKKILLIIALAAISASAFAQAQIDTKKVKIGDFTQKVTKVVLTGSALFDGVLQDEVAARWRVSPYEFCSLEEFNSLKNSDKYYFLLTTKGQFKKETEPLTGLLLVGSTVSRVCGLLTGGFSCWGAQSLGHVASAVVMRALSCSEACGILLEQRSNLCLLHRQTDSYLLDHQGSSSPVF